MRRRRFLQGGPALLGATFTGIPKAGRRTEETTPLLEAAPAYPRPSRDQATPVPVIGLGESGRIATRPAVAGNGPPGPYWRLVAKATARAHGKEGNPSPDGAYAEQVIAGSGAVRDSIISYLADASIPLAVFLGNPEEPFVAEQIGWLQAILAQTGTRAVWLRPPGQSGLKESPLTGPLMEMAPALEESDGLTRRAGLTPSPEWYYPTLLWGLLGGIARPSLIGLDLMELPLVMDGRWTVVCRARTKDPDRTREGVRAVIRQARSAGARSENLQGALLQLTAVPDMSVGELDAAMEVMRTELPSNPDADYPCLVGAPVGDYEGLLNDQAPVTLTVTLNS